MTRYEILGVPVDNIAAVELRQLLHTWLNQPAQKKSKIIVTPNPEIILESRGDSVFTNILQHADLALPDGIGLRFALAALSEHRLAHRHTGADTLFILAELCRDNQQRLMLLGGGNAKHTLRAAAALRERYPGLDVVTFDPGIVDGRDPRLSEATLASLERLSPQVIGIALGHGKQEKVMHILQQKFPAVRILMGMGGASDYVAAAAKRAPRSWQRWGFEWLWRLAHEPWRYKRMCRAVVLFPIVVAWTTLREGRLIKGIRNVTQEIRTHWRENRSSNNA